jgi:hypothetical protein
MAATMTPQSPDTARRLPLTRGRRTALAIGVPVCLALVAATGLNLVALFGEGSFPVRYTAPAAARSLTVDVAGGRLALTGTGTPADPATVTGTGRYSIIRSTLSDQAGPDGATFRYQCHFALGDCELDATVRVPAALPVSASTGGGNATVSGTAGLVTVSTGGGDLSARAVSVPLSLTTTGGNIRAVSVSSATVSAITGGGDVEIVFTRIPQDVQVDTGGGNITLVLPRGQTQYRVTAATGGGTVRDSLPLNSASAHKITASSGGGNITIREQ